MSERKLICDKCGGQREPRKESYGGKTYVRWRCLSCIRARTRAWVEKHPEEKKAKDRARRATVNGRESHRKHGRSEANKATRRTDVARARNRENARKQMKEHRERVIARVEAYRALVGTRPDVCPKCGNDPGKGYDGRSLIQFHHTQGYEIQNRFVGEWACTACHGKEHRRFS